MVTQTDSAPLDPFGGTPDPWWRDSAERALAVLAASGEPFTLDALRQDPFTLPEPHHPNQYGALAAAARRAGLIEPIGYQSSILPSRRGSVVRVWRGVTR